MNLNQITLPSIDLNKSIEFYSILGMHLIVDALPKYARFKCPDGEATFSIHLVDELPKENGISIYFEDDQLDNTVKELINKGIKFNTLPINQSWLWRETSLQDPDGNSIILYYAGKNRVNPPWRVN